MSYPITPSLHYYLPHPSVSHPSLTLFPFLSHPFPIFLSSLPRPASHHLFITSQQSLGSQFPSKRPRMDIFRQELALSSSLSTENKPCPNINAMLHREGHEVSLSLSLSPFSLFLSQGLVAPWRHGNYMGVPYPLPPSLPPCCPLDLCQVREQIGSGHGCMPKYSGKGSKEHICWVGKRAEMAWCLKGGTVEKVGWSKGERHRVRWEVESQGTTEVDGGWGLLLCEDWLITYV